MTSTPSSKVSLLTLALPHHASFISSAEEMLLQPTEFDLDYYSIKGRLTPVIGNSWSYEEDLTSIGFGDEPTVKPSPSSSTATTTKTTTTPVISGRHQTISELTAVAALDQSVRDLILDTLTADIKLNLPDNNNGAYGFGKQIARLAQLAHVAERVEVENGSTSVNSRNNTGSGATARRTYALLQMYLTMWLTGDDGSSGSLVYDASLGGILSKEGMKDPYSDFGNGRYNDHHFHYGYVLYAAAILGRRNTQFISQYGSYIDAIFYDVAHNSNAVIKNDKRDDAYFPLARHKSWFDGHSFASGLFPFADGKSQESSSEATNCYYGAYLWAKVRWGGTADGIKLVNFARVLLATELTGAKTYWHMVPAANSVGSRRLSNGTATFTTWQPPPAFNSVFEHNYMVGNLGMTDVTCSTWFGTENIYVHLINFMPVTAITTELFDKGKEFI
jgi:endo-1,3(4)-beta-glucanase